MEKRAPKVASAVLAILFALLALPRAFAEEPTKIVGYLIGSAPSGTQEVIDALNAKLKAGLGVKLELNYIGWNEVNSKYPLVLAAGDGVDWVYAAVWNNYSTQAARGAFKELNLDMIKKYMPRHWKATPAEAWEQAKVGGKIYMIPTATPDRKIPLAIIRGDLRKKYGLPPINNVKDLEPYLAAVKQNNPEIIPINLGNGYDIGQPFTAILNNYVPPIYSALIGTVYGNYEDKSHSLVNLLEEPYLSAYRKTAAQIQSWYKKGYINRAPFANTVLSKQSFAQGKSAVGFGNSQDAQEILSRAVAAGFEPEIIPILSQYGRSPADSHLINGAAIAANSKNWEKTLQFLDLIMEEPDYDMLVYFGIKGKNYELTADGKLTLPAGLDPDKNTYPQDAAGFWFTNKDVFPAQAAWTPQYVELKKRLKSILVPNTFVDFSFSPDKVKTEIASITNVVSQYENPLYIGAVADVDKAINTLAAKLKAAGQDKVVAEIRAQLAAYYR
jgi:putative aldouronate transport system substrate-binding protein